MFLEMEHNRIRKLMESEYCEFEDEVLVESPFAETTRDGRGLRQVALGLTPSKLVIAADILQKNAKFTCPRNLDASIESFELVSVYPLEFVTLSVFRRRQRRTLKARLIDGRVKYYELGGMECRTVFWSLWCDHVRALLARNEKGSSLSETTAASSSSASTLCVFSSGVEFDRTDKTASGNRRKCRVWAHYGGGDDGRTSCWRRKDVYLGPSYDELNHGYYTPVPVTFAGASLDDLARELRDDTPKRPTCKKTCTSWPCTRTLKIHDEKKNVDRGSTMCNVLFTRERKTSKSKKEKNYKNGRDEFPQAGTNRLHRFATSETSAAIDDWRPRKFVGSKQKRRSGSPRKNDVGLAPKLSRFGFGVRENCSSGLYLEPWTGDRDHYRRDKSIGGGRADTRELMESSVRVWEDPRESRNRAKHPRRYGLSTAGHFFRGLGPWSVEPGERMSVQRRRASSALGMRRRPVETELRLPVSKRQLSTSVSMTSLQPGKSGIVETSARGPIVVFWTPEYWYRPRAAATAYRELRKHLNLLREFHRDKEFDKNSNKKFGRKKRSTANDFGERSSVIPTEQRSKCILGRIFSSRDNREKCKKREKIGDGGIGQLKRLLTMDLRITAWDLDSTTIARQLTIIDRDLFLRIPGIEIEIMIFQKSSKNAPNIGAWIAFGHRISCLTASELLSTQKLDMRTRLLSRFINAAEKCYDFGNFQSCRSLLAGLQSPGIYRLSSTWSRLRIRHSTRYRTMERLSRIFGDTRSKSYVGAWKRCEKRPPILPFVGDLIDRIIVDAETKKDTNRRNVVWKNRRCDSSIGSNRGTEKIGTAKDVRASKCSMKNDEFRDNENAAEVGRCLGGRIFSAAITRMRGKSEISCSNENNNFAFVVRERILARRVFWRWRRFVATSKIIAERRNKFEKMDARRKKVLEIGVWLMECQRLCRGYDFSGHSLAWEFLLKARYREDRENFFISLKLEPPLG